MKRLEREFKKGFGAGYIDEEGYILNTIPMAKFNGLKKARMVREEGNEFRICKSADLYINIITDEDEIDPMEYSDYVKECIQVFYFGDRDPECRLSRCTANCSGYDEFDFLSESVRCAEVEIVIDGNRFSAPLYDGKALLDEAIDNKNFMKSVRDKFGDRLQALADKSWEEVRPQLRGLSKHDDHYMVKFKPEGWTFHIEIEIWYGE